MQIVVDFDPTFVGSNQGAKVDMKKREAREIKLHLPIFGALKLVLGSMNVDSSISDSTW